MYQSTNGALTPNLICAVAPKNRTRCAEENIDVCPGRPRLCILQVKPDHFIEFDTASAVHLPRARDPRFHFQYPATVPRLIGCHLVGNWRARAYQRHIPFENIQKLRELIQAGSSEETCPLA